ncbi:MAG: GNAT family N-acetyltransferase [Lewinellaceae bacterium]|nr:GNAT family N-acetyltransferase [Lewinellaceae bacterium]
MKIQHYISQQQLAETPLAGRFAAFVQGHPQGNFFQSPEFFGFSDDLQEYRPALFLALSDSDELLGSLLAVVQTNGSGLKSWFSRRMIVWGGPLISDNDGADKKEIAKRLVSELIAFAQGRSIYIEFRNFFDTADLRDVFESCGLAYKPHLNYLVTTDEEAAVKKRMSSSRMRQIKSSVKQGAEIGEANSEAEVMAFYHILEKLYREKVRKPLPTPELFLKFWKSGLGKFFVIRQESRVIGGIVCPVHANKVIYEWYVCGEDGLAQGLHPSVLATWAPIEYGVQNGFDHFDFMGAGRPDQDYGVREFKARFGGEEVSFGRYEMVVNKSLYRVGKIGLKVYQSIK